MNDQFVDAAVVASFWESGFKYRNEKATILKRTVFELFCEKHPGISKEFFHRTSSLLGVESKKIGNKKFYLAKKCSEMSDVTLLHPPHQEVEQKEQQQDHEVIHDDDRKMMNIELLPRYSMAVKELCKERRKNKKLEMEIEEREQMAAEKKVQSLWRGFLMVDLARIPPEMREQRMKEYKNSPIDQFYDCP